MKQKKNATAVHIIRRENQKQSINISMMSSD
jgi:hypothetical protein